MGCVTSMVEHKSGGGNAANLRDYMLRQDENEEVPEVLHGDMRTLERNDQRSRLYDHEHGNLHFIITSDREMKPADIQQRMENIELAYGFKFANHPFVMVRHQKPRTEGQGFDQHYHLGVAYTSLGGKAININAAVKKNEFIGRLSEFQSGHELIKGKHNKSVRAHAEKLGLTDFVAAIDKSGICDGFRAEAKFGRKEQATAQRVGIDLPALTAALKIAHSTSEPHKAILETLRKFEIGLKKGDRRNVVVLTHGDQIVGSLNRLLGVKQKDTRELASALQSAWKAEQPQQQPKQQEQKQEENDVRQSQAPRRERATTANAGGEAEKRQLTSAEKNERAAAKRARKKAAWKAATATSGATKLVGDQVGHKRDQNATAGSPKSGPRQPECNRSNATRNAEDVGENRRDGDIADELSRRHGRVDNELERDASRDSVSRRREAEEITLIEPFDAADQPSGMAPDRPSLTRMEVAQASVGWMRNGDAIKLNNMPRDEPLKPLPGVQTNAKSGPAQPRRPRMDMGHSPRLQASSVGGPVVVDITRMDAGEALKLINEANARSAGLKM